MNPKKTSVKCYYCNSTILSLTTSEILKLSGLSFRCECCGHENQLKESASTKPVLDHDPYQNIFSADQIILKKSSLKI